MREFAALFFFFRCFVYSPFGRHKALMTASGLTSQTRLSLRWTCSFNCQAMAALMLRAEKSHGTVEGQHLWQPGSGSVGPWRPEVQVLWIILLPRTVLLLPCTLLLLPCTLLLPWIALLPWIVLLPWIGFLPRNVFLLCLRKPFYCCESSDCERNSFLHNLQPHGNNQSGQKKGNSGECGILGLKHFAWEKSYGPKHRSSGFFCVTHEIGKGLLEWVVLCGLHGVQVGCWQSVASFFWARSLFWASVSFFWPKFILSNIVLLNNVFLLRSIDLLNNFALLSKTVLLTKHHFHAWISVVDLCGHLLMNIGCQGDLLVFLHFCSKTCRSRIT